MLAVIAMYAPVFGQETAEFRGLKANERIERKIVKDEAHIYSLNLKRGELLHITVEQRGINIAAAIASDTDRKVIRQVDTITTANGTEFMAFMAEADGVYMFGIFAAATGTPEGVYILQNNASLAAKIEIDSAVAYLMETGTKVYEKKDYGLAVLYHEHSIKLLGMIPVSPALGSALFALGGDYFSLREYKKAIDFYGQAAPVYRQFKDRSNEAVSLVNIAAAYSNLKDHKNSLDFYLQSLPIFREVKDKTNEVSVLVNIAGELSSLGEHEKSEAYYLQAIPLHRELKDSTGEAAVLRHLASQNFNRKKYREAAEYYASALVPIRQLNDKKLEAETANDAGDSYYSLREHDPAEKYYQLALELRRALSDSNGEAVVLQNLGNVNFMRYRTDAAISFYEQAEKIYRDAENTVSETSARLMAAKAYLLGNRNEEGEKKLLEVLMLVRDQKNAAAEADVLINLGSANRTMRRLDVARQYQEQALAKFRENKDRTGEANTMIAIADVLTETSQADEALVQVKAALKIFTDIGEKSGEAAAYRAMVWIYNVQSKYSEAITTTELALKLTRALEDPYGETDALVNLAIVYSALGQSDKAREIYKEALVLVEKMGSRYHESIIVNNIGYDYFRQQNYEPARIYLERSIKMLRELKYRHEEAYAVHNLGLVYYRLGNHKEALRLYDQALVIYLDTKARRPESFLYDSYGEVYRDLGQFDKASQNLEKSLVLSREIKYQEVEANALGNLMDLWKRRGQTRLAVFYGKQAVNTLQTIRGTNRGLSKESQKSLVQFNEKTYRRLADLLVEQGRLPEAQQVLDLLKEEEYFEFVRRDAAEAADQAKLALTDMERNALEQYNLLSGQLTSLGSRFQELQDKRTKSAGKLSEIDEAEFVKIKKQIEDSGEGLKAFLNKLSSEFSKRVEDGAVITTESIETMRADLRRMGSDVVLVSTYLLPERYRAIVTTGRTMVDRKVEYKDLKLNGADINKKIAAFKEALQNPRIDPRPLGKELYDIFVKPLEKDLQGAKAKTLLWSLDGSLRYIPIAALSPDGKTYLAEHYQNVIVTLSRQTNLFSKPTTDAWRAIGAGVSKQHTGFSALPSVPRELNSIVNDDSEAGSSVGVLGGKKLLDEAFSLEALRGTVSQQTDDGKPFNVVHLATHFSLGANNQDSALLLGDGKHLSLYDIGKDEELDFKDVELLTLSACETGVSTGEANGREVESLGMLAQQKGAKAVLATLWKVADESTSLFMSEFYRLKKDTPAMAKSEAMRQTQIAMIQGRIKSAGNLSGCRAKVFKPGTNAVPFKCDTEAPFSHPYFWSPFVLIGNWR